MLGPWDSWWFSTSNLLSKTWVPGRVNSLKLGRLKLWKGVMLYSEPECQKKKIQCQVKQSGIRSSLLFNIFVLFRSSTDWVEPTHPEKCFTSSTYSNISHMKKFVSTIIITLDYICGLLMFLSSCIWKEVI